MSPRASNNEEENVALGEEEEVENRRPRRNKKKLKLFGESGMTEQERRDVRKLQRELAQNLRSGDYATMEGLEEARNDNNTVFASKVCYTREAVLDADNVDLIAANYAQQVEKQVQVPRYDPLKLVQKLSSKCTTKDEEGSSFFNWKYLGIECGICFTSLPERVSFLAGALDSAVTLKKKTVRKKREKVEEDEAEEIKPEDVKNNKSDADKLSAMEKHMNKMKKKLHARTQEEMEKHPNGGAYPDIDGIKFLFNPKSFTQTVENIFNFGFLIKHGQAEIGVRHPIASSSSSSSSVTGLYVSQRQHNEEEEAPAPTQAVCSFTMSDWRRLCKAHHLEEGDLGHRKGSMHSRATSSSQ